MTNLPQPQTAHVGELEVGDFVVLFGNVKRPIVRFESYDDRTIVVVYSDGSGEKSLRALLPEDEIPAIRLAAYTPPTPSPAREDGPHEPDLSPADTTGPAAELTEQALLELYRIHGELSDLELHELHRDARIDAGVPFETLYAIQRLRAKLEKTERIVQTRERRDPVSGKSEKIFAISGGDVAMTLDEVYPPEPEL